MEWIGKRKQIGLLLLTEQRVKEDSLRKRPDGKPIKALQLAAGDNRLPGIEIVLPADCPSKTRILECQVLLKLFNHLHEPPLPLHTWIAKAAIPITIPGDGDIYTPPHQPSSVR